jgi:DNA-binding phage protein
VDNLIREAIEERKDKLGMSAYAVVKGCPDLCPETVYRYLRGESDGCGQTLSSIMSALGLKIVSEKKSGRKKRVAANA